MSGKLLIGTSGWSYKDWVGPFYPKGTVSGDYLPFYAAKFQTVEIDATFYRIPSVKMVEGWFKKWTSKRFTKGFEGWEY